MKIYEQLREVLKGREGEIFSSSELKEMLVARFQTNRGSVIPSDFCYNRFNHGARFTKHLFVYITRSEYKYVGENYGYTGLIFHKPQGVGEEFVIGEWLNGELLLYEKDEVHCASVQKMGLGQIQHLYEEYIEMLRFEMKVLGCKATELRHLIGRIGEFYCVLHTKGELAKETNQHGFDVVKSGRRISVKTTAQENGFVTINSKTFDQFDDFFVVQYVKDDFKLLFYGPKEEIFPIMRTYGDTFELEISKLKKMDKG
ncbi:DUF7225 domain-containing protein [Priestia taiwanensis]|uniref:Uncharacterized protein n=1 Tax=Priestia taiwanensis TaxID=1347902 RepID=A0A917ETQ4_9BACI|nr:hypothetical protein [Priestia taiwanensis]MBM7364765.1 hypothetical protein [Priestia taiwanensis]GGE79435.1 hypothetical protein GCM10007140_31290 [Priestia taiwanensis]